VFFFVFEDTPELVNALAAGLREAASTQARQSDVQCSLAAHIGCARVHVHCYWDDATVDWSTRFCLWCVLAC